MKLVLSHLQCTLTDFTLRVDDVLQGQVTALFGPSGAGKSSLLELVAGLRAPNAGRIELDGTPLLDVERRIAVPSRARGIGYVPQDQALFPHLSVRRNVLYGARDGDGGSAFSLAHVVEVLEIGTLLDRRPRTLSGGEKQRVALARALLSRPRLLLLDEPLASLDEALKAKALDLLRRVRAEFDVPILYVSHAAEEIVALCDQVLVMEHGQVLRRGTPGEIFERTTVPTLRVRRDAAE
jgi:molybdate transport system ATP-binding protein